MDKPVQNRPILAWIIRWIARIMSILSVGILLLFLVGEGDFSQPIRLSPQEWIGLLFFPFGVIAGMVVAWRREGLGAGITLGSLVAFYVSHFMMYGKLPRGPYFAMFALPGVVFGVSWLMSRQRKRKKEDSETGPM